MNASPGDVRIVILLFLYLQDPFVRGFFLLSLMKTEDNKFAWMFNVDAITKFLAEDHMNRLHYTEPFRGPTLLIYGEKSDYIDKDQIDLMKQWLPNLELHCVSGATHYLHVEQPNEFLKVTAGFINR